MVSLQAGTALTRFNLSATVGAAECPRVHSSVQSSIQLSYFFNSGSYRVLDCLSVVLWCFSVVTWVSSVSKVEIRSTSNSSEVNRIHVQQTTN
ncbi:unnamed protein product [Acanthoscelides obtectus]|uniref:Uncharacterized protein n=1 Tax=Acanthoscelides obtectus TaxID=200917 RepID=A0A9P0JTP6_ACAOB|nr:unnamed protein product [Acanthoscelides obtectus]CAK1637474.1 hypothetical protein AOBTE_LOCUS9992 [Acanthoscelides obtectus]